MPRNMDHHQQESSGEQRKNIDCQGYGEEQVTPRRECPSDSRTLLPDVTSFVVNNGMQDSRPAVKSGSVTPETNGRVQSPLAGESDQPESEFVVSLVELCGPQAGRVHAGRDYPSPGHNSWVLTPIPESLFIPSAYYAGDFDGSLPPEGCRVEEQDEWCGLLVARTNSDSDLNAVGAARPGPSDRPGFSTAVSPAAEAAKPGQIDDKVRGSHDASGNARRGSPDKPLRDIVPECDAVRAGTRVLVDKLPKWLKYSRVYQALRWGLHARVLPGRSLRLQLSALTHLRNRQGLSKADPFPSCVPVGVTRVPAEDRECQHYWCPHCYGRRLLRLLKLVNNWCGKYQLRLGLTNETWDIEYPTFCSSLETIVRETAPVRPTWLPAKNYRATSWTIAYPVWVNGRRFIRVERRTVGRLRGGVRKPPMPTAVTRPWATTIKTSSIAATALSSVASAFAYPPSLLTPLAAEVAAFYAMSTRKQSRRAATGELVETVMRTIVPPRGTPGRAYLQPIAELTRSIAGPSRENPPPEPIVPSLYKTYGDRRQLPVKAKKPSRSKKGRKSQKYDSTLNPCKYWVHRNRHKQMTQNLKDVALSNPAWLYHLRRDFLAKYLPRLRSDNIIAEYPELLVDASYCWTFMPASHFLDQKFWSRESAARILSNVWQQLHDKHQS